MSDKSKPRTREEIFEVFRPQAENDISSENYLLKKPPEARTVSAPLRMHHISDMTHAPGDGAAPLSEPVLSGADATTLAKDPSVTNANSDSAIQAPDAIRLQTFRIDMEERLAAIQAAQQQAKDQLSELEKKLSPGDTPPPV